MNRSIQFLFVLTLSLCIVHNKPQAEPLGLPSLPYQSKAVVTATQPQIEASKKTAAVYEVAGKAEIAKILADPDVAPYLTNSINDSGYATGKTDPVLMKWVANNYPAAIESVQTTEKDFAAR